MTSKQRARTAFCLGVPDKVPWGEFALDYDTVERLLGHKTFLRNKAGIQRAYWDGRRDEVVASMINDTLELVNKLEGLLDIVNVYLVPPKGYQTEKPVEVEENTFRYADGRVIKYSPITNDFTQVRRADNWQPPRPEDFDLDNVSEPKYDDSQFEMIRQIVAALGNQYYVAGHGLSGEAAIVWIGGMEEGAMRFLTEPELVKRAIAYQVERACRADGAFANLGIDGVVWGADFSSSRGPIISPRLFRDFCLPGIQRRVASAHRMGWQVLKHACGNNWELLDMFVEAGYDCYQAIQPSAGMDIAEVKRRYGTKFSLWGGVQVENLVSGTPEDVAADVRYALQHAAPGGGFVFGTTHTVAVGTRYDNFMRMLDEFARLRECYP